MYTILLNDHLTKRKAVGIMLSLTRMGCNEHCPETEGFIVDPITEHGFESFQFEEKVGIFSFT